MVGVVMVLVVVVRWCSDRGDTGVVVGLMMAVLVRLMVVVVVVW